MSQERENQDKPGPNLQQASGCIVTSEDEPAVVASLACFAAYIVYGASAASLGAALPSLAEHFHRSKAGLGIAFTVRGVGYFMGTIGSAGILNTKQPMSKEMMTCICLLFTGVTQGIISSADSFLLAMISFFIQGVGYGGIDTMANCVLPEVWGKRVQPWMQALHSCFGIGAILGPAFVGALKYSAAFKIIMVASFVPIVGLVTYNVIKKPPCVQPQHSPLDNENTPYESKTGSAAGEETINIAPWYIRFIVSLFFFTYVGAETGFAGWIPTYVLLENVTDSNSKAAYLSSIFWAALTAGRILAVPAAIVISATTMIRIQLALIVSTCLLGLFLLNINYSITAFVCFLMGFSLSSIFPVMMTIFGDYGFSMDPSTTSMFMVGATFGESMVPVLMGWVMDLTSPSAIPIITFLSALVLLAIYLYVHHKSTQIMASAESSSGKSDWGSRSQHSLLPSTVEYNPINGKPSLSGSLDPNDEEEEIELTEVNFDDEVIV